MAPVFDTTAKTLYTSLVAGEDLTIPSDSISGSDFQIPPPANPQDYNITKLNIEDLTNTDFGPGGISIGVGAVDSMMKTFMSFIREEYSKNRLTSTEYSKTLIASMEIAANTGLAFLTARNTDYWQAMNAQAQLVNARMALQIAKAQLANQRIDAYVKKVTYALTKSKLATEQAGFFSVLEQSENHRAQTLDTRSDGTNIAGLLGKQKDLYSQQITSYKRDAEVKAGKMWIDAWVTMKTIDEGLLPPQQFTNAEINEVLSALKANNALGS